MKDEIKKYAAKEKELGVEGYRLNYGVIGQLYGEACAKLEDLAAHVARHAEALAEVETVRATADEELEKLRKKVEESQAAQKEFEKYLEIERSKKGAELSAAGATISMLELEIEVRQKEHKKFEEEIAKTELEAKLQRIDAKRGLVAVRCQSFRQKMEEVDNFIAECLRAKESVDHQVLIIETEIERKRVEQELDLRRAREASRIAEEKRLQEAERQRQEQEAAEKEARRVEQELELRRVQEASRIAEEKRLQEAERQRQEQEAADARTVQEEIARIEAAKKAEISDLEHKLSSLRKEDWEGQLRRQKESQQSKLAIILQNYTLLEEKFSQTKEQRDELGTFYGNIADIYSRIKGALKVDLECSDWVQPGYDEFLKIYEEIEKSEKIIQEARKKIEEENYVEECLPFIRQKLGLYNEQRKQLDKDVAIDEEIAAVSDEVLELKQKIAKLQRCKNACMEASERLKDLLEEEKNTQLLKKDLMASLAAIAKFSQECQESLGGELLAAAVDELSSKTVKGCKLYGEASYLNRLMQVSEVAKLDIIDALVLPLDRRRARLQELGFTDDGLRDERLTTEESLVLKKECYMNLNQELEGADKYNDEKTLSVMSLSIATSILPLTPLSGTLKLGEAVALTGIISAEL